MMSLDKLAVIFIIIILPISVVLAAYTGGQAETLKLQLAYDQKLSNATADAIKAFQLNAFNESTSDLASMKIENIDAAANAFFNSIATNFNMTGYSKEEIQDYVPALVFTMYDGYYIYSRYTNTLEDSDYFTGDANTKASTYQNGKRISGIKPFVSYSCRYKNGGDDFVISYTLDNFISIQGYIQNNWVNDSGYLVDITKTSNVGNIQIKYRDNIIINNNVQVQKEYIGNKQYICKKYNGVKYYFDENHVDSAGISDPKWFTLINGTKNYVDKKFSTEYDYSAINYYKEAIEFSNRVKNKYKLDYLTTGMAVDEKGQALNLDKNMKIFNFDKIEEKTSNFNEHRLSVIKYTIEKNLSIAIKNYNHYSPTVEADFQMPVLNDTEWDKILNNMTLISFLQGLPIGGKIYNGCSVIANNKNDEVVSEESIYLIKGDTYYKPTYTEFTNTDVLTGVYNVDLERRTIESQDNSIEDDNYYPIMAYADYDSVVSPTKNANIYAEITNASKGEYAYNGNIYQYMVEVAKTKPNVAIAYFTALGKERNDSYKVNRTYKTNISNDTISSFNIPSDAVQLKCNNHKYYYFSNELTWHEAERYCESLGGHLVTINSENEANELKEYVSSVHATKTWIGATEDQNGTIKWTTGEKYREGNTIKNVKTNDLKDYMGVAQLGTYLGWNRYYIMEFICEWE